jgi:chromosomal replication initiation ATPase DnaA
MSDTHTQLPLPLPHTAGTEPFLDAPSNEEARAWLARPASWPQGRLLLFGPEATGKSILARAWAGTGPVLPGPALAPPTAPPHAPRLAIDAADQAPEHALLHWINAAAEARAALLLIARAPPARLRLALPDLASRLRGTLSVGIAEPEDALLRALLARHLAARQIAVPEAVQDWLLTRLPRTAAAIAAAAVRLDRASLARQLPVTRGLAREILADLLLVSDDDA